MRLNGESLGYPATLAADKLFGKELTFDLSGSRATLTLTGLLDAGETWQIEELMKGGYVPLSARF